jgi:hypothetical protein
MEDGKRVYVIREANTPGYWDVRYPDGYVYTVHEIELQTVTIAIGRATLKNWWLCRMT